MKIVTILGARPQFIKAAPVSRAIAEHNKLVSCDPGRHSVGDGGSSLVTGSPSLVSEFLVHTGQHYDHNMSKVFFDELGIPEPNVNLGIGSGSHGRQTGQMLMGIEEVLQREKPDWVLVYGDTNSTLAGALAAVKLHIPVAHVEAGLRSFNREMPEEHNRVLTDHCADMLFCPTHTAVDNLEREGITKGVHLVGDTMYDAVQQFSEIAQKQSTILQDLQLEPKGYLLVTVHRPYNTDNPENLGNILEALSEIPETVVFPVHPRTKQYLINSKSSIQNSKLRCISPVGYLDMLMLEKNARMILTDSGGMQKEAYFFGVPCITLRPETEWVETVDSGWNVLVASGKVKILQYLSSHDWPKTRPEIFGKGRAAGAILAVISATDLNNGGEEGRG